VHEREKGINEVHKNKNFGFRIALKSGCDAQILQWAVQACLVIFAQAELRLTASHLFWGLTPIDPHGNGSRYSRSNRH
jgi:hypothetical protein